MEDINHRQYITVLTQPQRTTTRQPHPFLNHPSARMSAPTILVEPSKRWCLGQGVVMMWVGIMEPDSSEVESFSNGEGKRMRCRLLDLRLGALGIDHAYAPLK